MFSRYFIERPILSNVIALVIVLIGAVCLVRLPVAQYPNVTPPTVSVTTRYPGASAKVIMDTIALPIEQQVNGVPGMIYMQSTSASDGTYSLIVTFEIGTDPDMAQVLVQNRVASALAQLPEAVQIQGVTTQKQSTAVLMFLALTSPDKRFDSLFLANYGVINLQNELARLPGVGNVTVYGAGQYAMRVWMNPNLLQSFGLTPEDVVKAIQQQSQEVTAGVIGMPPAPKGQNFQYTVNVAGRFDDVRQFENIVVKADNANGGQITRIKDIGRVELGAQTYSQSFTLNNLPSAGIGIYLLPAANALDVAKRVRAKMDQLAKNFPPGLVYSVPVRYDGLRAGLDQRGLHHPHRGWCPGADRHSCLPPGLARHARTRDDGAGDHHRGLCGYGRAWLHRQPVDAFRARPCHRHRGRRRNRYRGGRGAPHRGGHAAARSRGESHGRIVRSHYRDHARFDVGFSPRRLFARANRPALPAIRPRDRCDRTHQRRQCRDLEADAMRSLAARGSAS